MCGARHATEGATVQYRTETDSMGDVNVPADAYYMASTQRAVDNFPISNLRFSRRFIWALGLIKGSVATVARRTGSEGFRGFRRHASCRRRGDGRGTRRPVRARHLPDRLWHLHQHQCQRGDRRPRLRTARRRAGAPTGCIPTTMSITPRVPTTSSRPPSTWPQWPRYARNFFPPSTRWRATWLPRPASLPTWSSRAAPTSWTQPR
jgi:hypothetical protein